MLKMAENSLMSAGSDYMSILVSFRNLRFMTLIKENCLVSDLIKEVESTLEKLCSVKVTITMLKNSKNAILPAWYPLMHLIKNGDEISASTDNAAEVLNMNGNHGNFAMNVTLHHNVTPPFSNGVGIDSGFTSPVVRIGASEKPRDKMGLQEQAVLNMDRKDDEGLDGNLTQDEIFSEVFSMKDHHQNATISNQNAQSKTQYSNTPHKTVVKKPIAKTHTQNEQKSNDKTILSENCSDSSNNSSDEYSSELDELSKTAKNTSKPSLLIKTNLETKKGDQKKQVKRKNTFQIKPRETSVLGAVVGHKRQGNTSNESTDDVRKEVDEDKKKELEDTNVHSSKNGKKISNSGSVGKKKPSIGKSVEVDVDKINKLPNCVESERKANSEAISGRKMSESSDDSSESDVEENSNNKTLNMKDKTVESNNLKDSEGKGPKSYSKHVSNKKEKTKVTKSLAQDGSNDEIEPAPIASSDSESTDIDNQEDEVKSNARRGKGNDSKENFEIITKTVTSKKGENNKLKKQLKEKKQSESFSMSSWTSSEDENIKVVNSTTLKKQTEMTTRDEGGDKDKRTSIKGGKSEKPAFKSDGEQLTKANTKLKKKKTKNDDKQKESNLLSPAKSVKKDYGKRKGTDSSVKGATLTKKGKDNSTENNPAVSSPNSIAHSKKNVSRKIMADFARNNEPKKPAAEEKSDNESSESSDITLKAPFTQLPAPKSAHAVDPNTSLVLPQTPSTSQPRQSAVHLSASKVASWLLDNPVSESVNEKTGSVLGSPQKSKAGSKIKKRKNVTNMDTVEEIVRNSAPVTPKASQSQKRKVEEVNEQEPSQTKKNKKRKSDTKKQEKPQQLKDKTVHADKQEKTTAKVPMTSKKGKNTSLSLPKVSRGLAALVEDESDYSTMQSNKAGKQKLAPPTINRLKTPSGFLTPSDANVQRKSTGPKSTKPRIKRTLSVSQTSKTIEMNEKEKEFLKSEVMNLESLLNDERIKW